MAITIMQGDSYPIYLSLKQDGHLLTPQIIQDLEVCVGENLSYTFSGNTLHFDNERQLWYFFPSQEETLPLVGVQDVYARIKYPNTPPELYGLRVGKILVKNGNFEGVL